MDFTVDIVFRWLKIKGVFVFCFRQAGHKRVKYYAYISRDQETDGASLPREFMFLNHEVFRNCKASIFVFNSNFQFFE